MLVANAAAYEGIDLLTAHDCFACLPSRAGQLREIAKRELANMYLANDYIVSLRHQNAFKVKELRPPVRGSFDPREILDADYAWM
jgi:hypothetical protein